jgi:hypothetical protein
MIERAITLAVLALILPGFAYEAEWMQRQPTVESAIGTDPESVPVGTSSGPRGMGVDLSDRSSKGSAALGA